MLERLFRILKKKSDKKTEIAKDSNQKYTEQNDEILEKLFSVMEMKSDILVTVVGINHYFGNKPFKIGGKVYLVKDPENLYDPKAIKVLCDNFGKCGYVANSEHTVKSGTVSADILNDGINDICTAEILLVDEKFIVCSLERMSIYDLLINHCKKYMCSGNFSSALTLLKRLEEKWETTDVLMGIGECNYHLGNFDIAENYAQKVLELDSENSKIKSFLAKLKSSL